MSHSTYSIRKYTSLEQAEIGIKTLCETNPNIEPISISHNEHYNPHVYDYKLIQSVVVMFKITNQNENEMS